MLIVRLMGGLGNQLFQYALGRRLSLQFGQPLVLDLGFYDRDPERFRKFELAGLLARWDGLCHLSEDPQGRAFKPEPGLPEHGIYREKKFTFDPGVLKIDGPAFLDGYWQSERYFDSIADTLRADFAVRKEPDAANRELLASIAATESVCVHVRRGDYVAKQAYHGLCPPEYYEAARQRIEAQVASPSYFVFSDDPAWTREQFAHWPRLRIVDHNPPTEPHEDLRLMTACRHFIVANSSFSWWGAWLSKAQGKLVLAPKRWFAKTKINTRDLIPESWIKL